MTQSERRIHVIYPTPQPLIDYIVRSGTEKASSAVERPRRGLMSHMLDGGNVGLIVTRQCKGEPGAAASRKLSVGRWLFKRGSRRS